MLLHVPKNNSCMRMYHHKPIDPYLNTGFTLIKSHQTPILTQMPIKHKSLKKHALVGSFGPLLTFYNVFSSDVRTSNFSEMKGSRLTLPKRWLCNNEVLIKLSNHHFKFLQNFPIKFVFI